jgi:hypothetical protein
MFPRNGNGMDWWMGLVEGGTMDLNRSERREQRKTRIADGK